MVFANASPISTEETFEYDVRDEHRIVVLLRGQAEELARDLQTRALRAATIGVKIKRADFTVVGRQTSVVVPTNAAHEIYAAALHCWQRSEMAGKPIRLLGTRVATLTEGAARELSLFGEGTNASAAGAAFDGDFPEAARALGPTSI